MDTTAVIMLLVGLALGLLVGIVAARMVARAQSDTQAAQAREDAARARTDLAAAQAEGARAHGLASDARAETERVRAEVARLRTEFAEADAEVAEARSEVAHAQALTAAALAEKADVASRLASMEAQRDAALKRAEDLAADRDSLVDRFKVLSAETLERQGKAADATAEQRLRATEQLMAPVKESLQLMNERIAEVEKARAGFSAELREQVRSVVVTGENLRRETSALSTALRKPQVRGAWGELQLKRVAEIAGMLEYCDFLQQATTQTSTDQTIRPDMKVLLGEGKFIYVDSKVPLSAFLDAQEARDEQAREAALKLFGRNVKTHVDQLSAKNYWKADPATPEFTVLFIPSEALAAEALSQMPDLHEYAAGRNIILASPTTLIGLLRAVAYSWKQAALADSAAEVFSLGRELYDRLGSLGSNFDKLGRSLQSSMKAYNAAVGSMETRVMVTARRFRDLQVTDKELEQVRTVEEPLRQISASELVENAGQVETIIGRADERAEREALTRGEPSIEELVDSDSPVLPLMERKRSS
ncbi:DNA recombination protein RmuC [Luteococcus peritonei]|uniref:DNA recombination protein RmuC n=1 Tax=Luteococcus peritonei TaxID=88874 RepID=A0ABW4RXI8_9ACTN